MPEPPKPGNRAFEEDGTSRSSVEKTRAVGSQQRRFENEDAQRAELEKTRAMGPQPTIPAGALVPPLPLSNSELAAEAARACPKDGQTFAPIRTEAVDARAPWQADELKGSAAY